MAKSVLGIIGGSGVYDFDGLENSKWVSVKSGFGEPSDQFLLGTYKGLDMVFLPRHARGHVIPPSDINYRANIDCLKQLGVSDLISISACGSFRQELSPGTFVIVDQFIDRTYLRKKSFFAKGLVAHVSFGFPISPLVADQVEKALKIANIKYSKGGTYLAMEGPQFSSLAESKLYKSWGADVIGMTSMPEAKLAREAEICYATVAMVTDYDCWHSEHGEVSVMEVLKVLKQNSSNANELIKILAENYPRQHQTCPIMSDRALEHAIITPPEAREPEMIEKLKYVAARLLK